MLEILKSTSHAEGTADGSWEFLEAAEDGSVVGRLKYRLTDICLDIGGWDCPDCTVLNGMLRAVMHIALHRANMETVCFNVSGEDDINRLKALGFITDKTCVQIDDVLGIKKRCKDFMSMLGKYL